MSKKAYYKKNAELDDMAGDVAEKLTLSPSIVVGLEVDTALDLERLEHVISKLTPSWSNLEWSAFTHRQDCKKCYVFRFWLSVHNFFLDAEGRVYFKYDSSWWEVSNGTEKTKMWVKPPERIQPCTFNVFKRLIPHIHGNIWRMSGHLNSIER